MAERTPQQILDLIGHRRDWTPILLTSDRAEPFDSRLVGIAESKRWRLVSLNMYDGHLPPGLTIRGVLTRYIPDCTEVRPLRDMGVPIVRVGSLPHPEDHLVPAVLPDRQAFGRLAAEHFAERDFKHVGLIRRDSRHDNQTLFDGFIARARELGITCHVGTFKEQILRERKAALGHRDRWLAQREPFLAWLAETPKPLGLLGGASYFAGRFCLWAMESGWSVPQDVAVLCLGGSVYDAAGGFVPLSSIEEDEERTLVVATDLLERMLEGHSPGRTRIMIPPKGIITRESTDVLAASDPSVIRALRYMWDCIGEDLSVDQIAQHPGVSRRTLSRKFQEQLGRGVNAEFQRRKLEKARELIELTDLPIAEVAQAMGYNSPTRLTKVFTAAYGESPAKWRRQAASES